MNSGREGRICKRPKMIGWSLSQAGAPEMGISEEGAASCCTELPSQITPSYACCSQQDDCSVPDLTSKHLVYQ